MADEKDCGALFDKRKTAQERFRKQAKDMVTQLTLEEKAKLFLMQSPAMEKINLPAHHWWSEALHGVGRNGKATQFPQSICMASTWDPNLIQRMASAIGREARAKHHGEKDKGQRYKGLTIWSPTINMARDPRWGRNEETYGEDPLLTSLMGVAFVRGLQGAHEKYFQAIATVKHFIANNTEHDRYVANPRISEQTLREYYMPAYRAAVQQANVQSVMTAYNGINGVPCTANGWLINQVLRKEWGFAGTVVTDFTAPERLKSSHRVVADLDGAVARMLKAGIDISSTRVNTMFENVVNAVQNNLVSESLLDRAIVQNLTTRLQLGQLGDDPYQKIPMSVVGAPEHRSIAKEIAHKGIVLLQNKAIDIQPLLPIKHKKVILAGPFADVAQLGGYSGEPTHGPSTLLEVLNNEVEHLPWTNASGAVAIPVKNLKNMKGEYFPNFRLKGKPRAIRADKRIDFSWPGRMNLKPFVPKFKFSARWTGLLKPDRTGLYNLEALADDGMRVWLDDQIVIDCWDGKAGQPAMSRPIFLEAGKALPLKVEFFNKGKTARAHLKWLYREKTAPSMQEDALVIFVGGFDLSIADETRDVMDLGLPEIQRIELEKILGQYKNVVVVLNGGTIVADPWLFDAIPAVLQAWYPGQEGGEALADLLFGRKSPSGRLPLTWYASADNLPPMDDYEVSKGRTYMYHKKPVLFPFGHGLSYTSFEYDSVKLSMDSKEGFMVQVTLKNTGEYEAEEVVQVYVKFPQSEKNQPIKKLIGFTRIPVAPEKVGTADIPIPKDRLAQWDKKTNSFVITKGIHKIMVGASSGDIRETLELTME